MHPQAPEGRSPVRFNNLGQPDPGVFTRLRSTETTSCTIEGCIDYYYTDEHALSVFLEFKKAALDGGGAVISHTHLGGPIFGVAIGPTPCDQVRCGSADEAVALT